MSNEACVDPCNNVTALTVEFSETEVCAATLKWTAPAYMTDPKYNIYRDGTSIATDVSKIEYIDDKDLEQSKEYTWVVKTVCTDSESTGTEAKGSCPVGINELENNVSIYPNPATTLVTINGKDITKVEVYNMVGLLIETKTGIVTSIDVSSYNTGIYFFKVYDSNNNSVTKRVMIAK